MQIWKDGDLNDEQIAAINTPGNVFLIACPGSGKTRTLTYKIATELENATNKKRFVAAITYTHRAADEIKERIENLGIQTSKLWIGTLHSFCLEWILRPYSVYDTHLAHGFTVIDSFEREKLMEAICIPFRRPNVTHWDCDYYFGDDGYYLSSTKAELHPSIHEILSRYFAILAERRQIDFELILYHAHGLIKSQPQISVLLAKLFSHLLIDEYQDTKKIQYSIIASILKASRGETSCFMVGDPNQAIFQSLGGYAITKEDFEELCGCTFTPMSLTVNYRSSPRVINYFSNYNFHATTISPFEGNAHLSSIITYNNQVEVADLREEIVRLIEFNLSAGIPQNEICVLAPWWIHLAQITRQLVAAMPNCQFNGPGMVPFARDQDNFWYKLAKIALTDSAPEMYVRRLRWAKEVLEEMESAGVHVRDITAKSILRICNTIKIHSDIGLEYLEKFFAQWMLDFKIELSSNQQLQSHYETFFRSSEERIRRLTNDGNAFIADTATFRKVFQSRVGITISTIHGIKGAEYDSVIAYALLDGMVPHFKDDNKLESATKMIYVLASRARLNLHLISEKSRSENGATQVLEACVFEYDT